MPVFKTASGLFEWGLGLGTLWFLYTGALISIALVSCSLSLAVWLVTRRRDCVASAAAFAVYALDLALILFDEYSKGKIGFPLNFRLPLTHPLESVLLSVLFMASLWIWMLMRLHRRVTWAVAGIPLAVYAAVAIILVPKEGMSGELQQWAYWISRDLAVALCLGFAFVCYRRASTEAERLDLARSKAFFIVACVLALCVICEDTFMILVYRPDAGNALELQFLWYMSERNISENVLMVACAIQLLRRNQRVLSMYVNHPPRADVVPRASMPAGTVDAPASAAPSAASRATGARCGREVPDRGDASPYGLDPEMESRVMLFGDSHGLSARERDVLRLLLGGADTQRIASVLVISTGTVKAHLHRIYRKVDVSGRSELLREFWKA